MELKIDDIQYSIGIMGIKLNSILEHLGIEKMQRDPGFIMPTLPIADANSLETFDYKLLNEDYLKQVVSATRFLFYYTLYI